MTDGIPTFTLPKGKYMRNYLLLSAQVLCCVSCSQFSSTDAASVPPTGDTLTLPAGAEMDLLPLLQPYDTARFEIPYDVVLQRPKAYVGVSTQLLFRDLVRQYAIDSTAYSVTFLCKDGYAPIVPLHQLLNEPGYIALRDVDGRPEWEDSLAAKFSPAYLVWDLPRDDHQHAFPYGVVKIKFVQSSLEYRQAVPDTPDEAVAEGFRLFKAECIKCHTINGEGGAVGPELNYPKNVTEYWQPGQLGLFIKDPAAFRHNSRMPTLAHLTEADIERIVNYLTFMTGQKAIAQ